MLINPLSNIGFCFVIFQESLPVRYKKIIFINLSAVGEPVVNMVKKVLKQKFVQRVSIRTTLLCYLEHSTVISTNSKLYWCRNKCSLLVTLGVEKLNKHIP